MLKSRLIISLLAAATIAAAAAPSAHAASRPHGTPMPGSHHLTSPHPAQAKRTPTSRSFKDVVVVGDWSGTTTVNRGCTNWFWFSPDPRWVYYCETQQVYGAEVYQTDDYYYYWTGSRTAYYGHWRCSRGGPDPSVVVIGDSAPRNTCGWV